MKNKRMLMAATVALVLALTTALWSTRAVKAQGGPQTHLLFTFVTNQSGLDTGFAIANTTQDPFGTGNVSGACVLNFYGANAPAAVLTAVIPGGGTFTGIASVFAPNFQGYMIVDCNFPLAHGWYFHTQTGVAGFQSTATALVIPSTSRTGSLPESLAH